MRKRRSRRRQRLWWVEVATKAGREARRSLPFRTGRLRTHGSNVTVNAGGRSGKCDSPPRLSCLCRFIARPDCRSQRYQHVERLRYCERHRLEYILRMPVMRWRRATDVARDTARSYSVFERLRDGAANGWRVPEGRCGVTVCLRGRLRVSGACGAAGRGMHVSIRSRCRITSRCCGRKRREARSGDSRFDDFFGNVDVSSSYRGGEAVEQTVAGAMRVWTNQAQLLLLVALALAGRVAPGSSGFCWRRF